ncbi:hypothetical protein CsSME_00015480 [Camellia sinensis var. sinensis]
MSTTTTGSITKPHQRTTCFFGHYSRSNVEPLSSATLYRSQAGRNTKPPHNSIDHMLFRRYVLSITSWKETNPYSNITIHQFIMLFIITTHR